MRGDHGRAHGAVEGRQGESRAFLREGPLRLGLRQPPRPHPEADDAREDHRSVARGELGRGDRPRRLGVQAHPGGSTARMRSASSPRRAAPTKRPIWCRSWRAQVFGNNNTDTCARVCHSPTGYGLSTTFGTSAGTQDFDSVEQADVIMVIGANPTDGHPVFASRMKKRLRAGREADRDRSAPHRPGAHAACRGGVSSAAAARHQRRDADRAGACHRHRGPGGPGIRARALRCRGVRRLGGVRRRSRATARRRWRSVTGVPAATIRGAARLYATGGNGAIYYGLGVTEHSQGSTAVMALANLAMATGNIGRRGVGVNPLRGQNNVQGSCDMGSFPHELPGYRHISDPGGARDLRARMGRDAGPGAGPAHPQHARRGARRHASAASTSRARTSRSPIPTRSTSPPASRRWNASWCTTCS